MGFKIVRQTMPGSRICTSMHSAPLLCRLPYASPSPCPLTLNCAASADLKTSRLLSLFSCKITEKERVCMFGCEKESESDHPRRQKQEDSHKLALNTPTQIPEPKSY